MKMFVQGDWRDSERKIQVKNPFDQSVVDEVPRAEASDVDAALEGAVKGAEVISKIPAYDRAAFLRRTADLILERGEDFAKTISLEEGKTLTGGRVSKPLARPRSCSFRPRSRND